MSIKVEVFASPGCSKCGQAREVLRKLAEEIGGGRIEWREVNVLCNVETLLVASSATNPGCANTGPNPANKCFTPGGYVLVYRIDADHVGSQWKVLHR